MSNYKSLSRRKFLGKSGLLLTGMNISAISKIQASQSTFFENDEVPLIHATDLYHTHGDPDDHWDLASIYSLAFTKDINLKGILIDFPPKRRLGDPDVMGVAQLNYITGMPISTIIGTPYPMEHRNDVQSYASKIDHQGIQWVIDTLKKSPTPVVINIVGAATDIAVAAKKEPNLFHEKCRSIYLNAGSANNGKDNKLEFNVKLNPSAFAAIFDIDCPIYWLPCWNETEIHEVGEYGSYFRFLQNDILPHLPDRLQNYFLFMLGQKKSHKWLNYLINDVEHDLLEYYNKMNRNMWCIAGFLYAAGKKVTCNGEIVSLHSKEKSVFSFIPIDVNANDDGFTQWQLDTTSQKRYIVHVDDIENYQTAMTIALKNLLLNLPK
ncbi:MAG: nucleoside hydrolase [Bacteroidales bacterium]|nr:nucleoside hydrolase [Bacteroidales bacterium]